MSNRFLYHNKHHIGVTNDHFTFCQNTSFKPVARYSKSSVYTTMPMRTKVSPFYTASLKACLILTISIRSHKSPYRLGSSMSPSVPSSLRLPTARPACHTAVCSVGCCSPYIYLTCRQRHLAARLVLPQVRRRHAGVHGGWPSKPVRTRPSSHCQCASMMSLAGSWKMGCFSTLPRRKQSCSALQLNGRRFRQRAAST